MSRCAHEISSEPLAGYFKVEMHVRLFLSALNLAVPVVVKLFEQRSHF